MYYDYCMGKNKLVLVIYLDLFILMWIVKSQYTFKMK